MSLGLLTSTLRAAQRLKDVNYSNVFSLESFLKPSDDQDFSHIRRHKTQLELVLLSCAVCGIEFCYAAETAFVSPTLLKIGVPVTYMTLIWCLSPIIGFLLTPVLGSLSDRCRSKLGRRRPFIMLFSVGVVLGLLLVPNGETLGVLLGDTYTLQVNGTPSMNNVTVSPPVVTTHSDLVNSSVFHLDVTTERGELINTTSPPEEISHTWSILFTVLGVVMLDFSCDACQSPCRAYLLDVSIPADHHPGLSTFTVMAGLGGSLGYVLGGINWENTGFGESLGGHVRVVFTFVLIIYIICVVLTLTSVREVPLDYLGIPEEHLQKKKTKQEGTKYRKFNNEDSDSEEERETMKHYGSINSTTAQDIKAQEHLNQNHITHHHENNDTPYQGRQNGDHCLAQKTGSPAEVNGGVMNSCTQARPSIAPLPSEVSLKTYLRSIVKIPRSLLVLCLTNLFCWMSLVCYSLYFTDFVGQTVYGGNPSSPPGSPERALYESGVRMGSFGMSLYSLSCAIYSLCIENFVNKFGARTVYICSQLVYTVGAALMGILRNRLAVLLLSPCAGVMYATLFTMPYLLVAHYHSSERFEEEPIKSKDETTEIRQVTQMELEQDKLQQQVRGLGTDIALVSSMLFLAQLVLSSCMGVLINAAGSTAIVMATASVLSFCGAVTATQVMYLEL